MTIKFSIIWGRFWYFKIGGGEGRTSKGFRSALKSRMVPRRCAKNDFELKSRKDLGFWQNRQVVFNNNTENGDGFLQAYHCQSRRKLFLTTIVKILYVYIWYTYIQTCEQFGSARAQLGHVVICTPWKHRTKHSCVIPKNII